MSDDFDTWLAEREKDDDSTDDVETLRPGQRVGAYRIIRQLGVGGMGQVYEAEHVALGVRRALKVFSTVSEHSEFLRKRFVAEGRILADLQHPRIVRVYDLVVDEDSGMAYFEMDLVLSPNGQPRTLADELKDGVDEEKIAGWFKDICEGLAYIHSQGVVHRDISLDNILIDGEGRAVITDFGVAKIIDDSYRRKIDVTVTMVYKDGTEVRMGKDRYMAPELKKQGGKVSFASDAWAVGVLLFHMLSGSWYDVGTRLEDWLADLKYDWRPVIAQLCNVDPAKRLGDGGIAALPAMVKRKGRLGFSWRQKWVIVSVIAAILLVAVFGASRFLRMSGMSEEITGNGQHSFSVGLLRQQLKDLESEVETENRKRPAKAILKGADRGKREDMVLAAELYSEGKGVATNYAKSVELYRKAIGQGSFDAVGGMGLMYEHGWGVTNNLHAAYLMYLVAAANGVSNSVQDVIRCYENGIGVSKNLQEAKRWMRRKVLKPLEQKAEDVIDSINEDIQPENIDEYGKILTSSKLIQIGGLSYLYGVSSNGSVCILRCGKDDMPASIKKWSQQKKFPIAFFLMEGVNGSLIIPDKIDSKPVERIESCAFQMSTNLVSITLPETIRVVNGYAFGGCKNLTKVSLPEGLLDIGQLAFYDCEKLHNVVLPHSVTNIGMLAFYPTPPIVPANHPHFTFKEGGLYSKDLSTLFAYYGSNETFSVAPQTKHIAKGAFAQARWLKKISLPKQLETVADYAFWRCSSLESVVIPAAVTNIGSCVFAHCYMLSAVYYQGRIPYVADNMYEGAACVFSFVKKDHGWENSSGALQKQWPDQVRMDADLLNRGNFGKGSCHAVRYWDGGKILSREEIIPLQVELLRAEATRGNVSAMKQLAWKYEHGIDGVVKDIDEVVKFLEGAANGGNDGEAMCRIADFYRKGIKGKRNYPEAVRWYRNALEYGGQWSMRACQELANLYRNGLGVERDKETAFMLTLIAAAHKMSGAQCVLSDCYEKGIGVETNLVEAARWDREAERTCWSGHELGLWYKYGGGVVDKDPKKAFRWFMYGTKQGNGVSAVEIANCYKTGYGVEKDLSKVYGYSMIGVRKGWSCGMRSVAECFENGWGVETNLVKAAEWYIKAAEADTDYWDGGAALIKAGDCYAEGRGVEKDYAKARVWYQRAVDMRHSDAAKRKIADLEKKIGATRTKEKKL